MKIRDQKLLRTLKNQTVGTMLQDNKVPGTSARTRAAEASGQGAGSVAGFLGESQTRLCERPGDN